jgi:hypothetical protein
VRLREILDTIPTLAWCNLPDGSHDFVNQQKFAAIYHPQQRILITLSPSPNGVAADGPRASGPELLAEKLRKIRSTFGLSQTDLNKSFGVEEGIPYTRISDYELGKNDPLFYWNMHASLACISRQSLMIFWSSPQALLSTSPEINLIRSVSCDPGSLRRPSLNSIRLRMTARFSP